MALRLCRSGNKVPRLVLQMSVRGETPAPVLAAERFAAMVLVGAGLASLAVWIWWPAEQMMLVAGVIVLAAFGLAAANWARVLLTGGGAAISLIGQTLTDRIGVPVAIANQSKSCVAYGLHSGLVH